MVDWIVTFKLSLATGARDRMVQFDGNILTYSRSDTAQFGTPFVLSVSTIC